MDVNPNESTAVDGLLQAVRLHLPLQTALAFTGLVVAWTSSWWPSSSTEASPQMGMDGWEDKARFGGVRHRCIANQAKAAVFRPPTGY
jgi:hypothetical protein